MPLMWPQYTSVGVCESEALWQAAFQSTEGGESGIGGVEKRGSRAKANVRRSLPSVHASV